MRLNFITNSDFGLDGKIGFRTFWPAKKMFLKDHKITVFSRKNMQKIVPTKLVKIPFAGYRLFNLSLMGLKKTLFYSLPSRKITMFVFDLMMSLRLKKSDIVHSWDLTPICFKKAKKMGATTILDIQMALTKYENGYKYVDYFFAPSDYVRDTCVNVGIDSKKIIKIPFGVDISRFKPPKSKPEKFRVIFSGQASYRKGTDFLLQAWDELKLKDAELVIAGPTNILIKNFVKKYKNRKDIKFLGYVKRDQMINQLRKSSLYVFPSLQEGSAKTVYEAMACGLPVVATYESGPVARDGKDGFIIPCKNKEEIKKKIMYFYNNRSKLDTMGKSARKRVEKFTWDYYGDSITKQYDKIFKTIKSGK